MPDFQTRKLTNANVYLNGNTLLGRADEFDIPELNFKMTDTNALGLFGSFELPAGLDKLEARVKWNSYYDDVLAAANPTQAVQIMVRGNLEEFGSAGRVAEMPFVCVMTGIPKKAPGFKFKQHENVEMESTFSVTRVKLTVDGVTKMEVDVMANICKINGVDILANFRANS